MAGSAVIGTLRAILSLDTAEFDTASARVSSSAKAWTRDFQSIGQQATRLGTTLTTALTVPLLGLGSGAAKLAMDFESSFAGVKKTVNATEPEFAAMAQSFRDLSKQIPVNVNELNKLGEAAGALGIPKEEIVDFTRVMALLGVTTNLTSEQAATSIGKIQNIFGAAGKNTENFASSLVALGNAGASTETEIVEMAARIAGAGQVIGITQSEVLGFASTLASVGINAEAGGSAISRVFLKMNDAVDEGGDKLAEFARVAGMSSAQFKSAFEDDAAGAVTAFVQGLGRVKASGENVNGVIEGLTGKNIILKDTLLRLAGAGDLLADQLKVGNDAWRANTALTAEAEKRFETTSAQMTLLWNKFKDVGITLGNALLPAIRETIKLFDSLLPYLEAGAKWFGELNPKFQLAAVGFLAIVAAAGPALVIFGQMAIGLSTLTAAFATNGIAMRAMTVIMGQSTVAAGLMTTALSALGYAAGITVAAIAGWQIGKFIGEVTGATTAIQNLTEKMMGYRDASVPMDAQQRAINQALKLGAAEGISYAEALTFLQKRGDELRASTAASVDTHKEQTKVIKASSQVAEEHTVTKKQLAAQERAAAKDAADLTREMERQRAAVHALGLTTKQELNEEMGKAIEGFSLALAAGVPLKNATAALADKFQDLATQAKDSNIEVEGLSSGLADLRAQMLVLDPIPARLMGTTDFSAITNGLQSVSLEASKARMDADRLSSAYSALGITTSTELHAAAEKAREAYALIAASGTATSEQLIAARNRVVDAEFAAGERTLSLWQGQIQPALLAIADEITGLFTNTSQTLWGIGHDFITTFADIFIPGMGQVISAAWPVIQAGLGKLWDGLKSFGRAVGNFFSNLFGGGEGVKTNDLRDELKRQLGGDASGAGLDALLAGNMDPTVNAAYDVFMTTGNRTDLLAAADILRGATIPQPSFNVGSLSAASLGLESVSPEGAAIDPNTMGDRSMTVVLEQDGRKTAQWLVPYIPEEVFRLELA